MKKLFVSAAIFFAVFSVICTFGAWALRLAYPTEYKKEIVKYYDDWRLILSLIKAESGFRPDATSNAGACGLMQILPSTAEFMAQKNGIEDYDLYNAQDNIRLGCLYLRYLEGRFSDFITVLAAYNAGEGTVKDWLQNKEYSLNGVGLKTIPYSETKRYVKKIQKYYANYRKIYLTNESKWFIINNAVTHVRVAKLADAYV